MQAMRFWAGEYTALLQNFLLLKLRLKEWADKIFKRGIIRSPIAFAILL